MILLDLILGIDVDFHKSLLVVINVAEYWLVEAFVVLNYKISLTSCNYLGLAIGGNHPRLPFW